MNKNAFRVLIIDDEEAMRDACLQVLKKDGYQADAAADGLSGLDRARAWKPDVALVDLKMPGMGGLEVLPKIKEINPDIIPIVITGYATIDAAVEAMKQGAYDFLPKPFSPDQLRLTISRAIEKRAFVLENEKLRREKRLMEENFITMVSHQMRSPLAAVSQYLEALLAGSAGELGEVQRSVIQKSRDRLATSTAMINEWLSMARMNRGDLLATIGSVDLPALIGDLVTFYRPVAEKKQVTLAMTPQGAVPPAAGDRGLLREVFSNLLINAINYNRQGGSVTASIRSEPPSLIVEIRDTGIGIDSQHLPFIFDEFYRVKRTDGVKTEGTGLGLAIVRKIVTIHEGSVSVASTPGQGTTFTVVLPAAKGTL
jgi:two-component system sensor histidine kinase/response regulator